MTITSLSFFVFFLISLFFYYYPYKKNVQWLILLAASSLFVWSTIGYKFYILLPMLFTLGVAWAGALVIGSSNNDTLKRIIVCLTILGILVVLAKIKYENFGIIIWNLLSGEDVSLVSTLAPLGISYYSLSAIGYVLDVYWGNQKAQKNVLKFVEFLFYYPVLTSGPILRYEQVENQLYIRHPFCHKRVLFGLERILYGLFKKLVIADRAAIYVGAVYSDYEVHSGWYIPFAVVLFSLQLYADFSGCMDIICGISECYGIELPENFRQPFFSQSVAEFWKRWHVSMGEWFKQYLLYPLLKSRLNQSVRKSLKKRVGKKASKCVTTYLCMMVLWVAIGIWHGGAPKFVLASGVIPGVFLVLGDAFSNAFGNVDEKNGSKFFSILRMIRTYFCLCISWFFVRASNVSEAVNMLKYLTVKPTTGVHFCEGFVGGVVSVIGMRAVFDYLLLLASAIVVIYIDAKHEAGVSIRERIYSKSIIIQDAFFITFFFVIVVFGNYGPAYNAVDFIYKTF